MENKMAKKMRRIKKYITFMPSATKYYPELVLHHCPSLKGVHSKWTTFRDRNRL
jgi:hypothetical protein